MTSLIAAAAPYWQPAPTLLRRPPAALASIEAGTTEGAA
jgi:hypothetical protein